jgi:hypothetical protein
MSFPKQGGSDGTNHIRIGRLDRDLFAFEVLVPQLGASLNEKRVTGGEALTKKTCAGAKS